jgi:hypothetical protein
MSVSSEFTDDMLRGKILSFMPPYPANWSPGMGGAFFTLKDVYHSSGSGGKMRYHFRVKNFQETALYLVSWQQITTYPTAPPNYQEMRETVVGSGDPGVGVCTQDHDVPMPSTPCSITESTATVEMLSPPLTGGQGNGE